MTVKQRIIELHKKGLRNAEIGRQIGCSRAYVSAVIKGAFGWTGFVPALGEQHQAWLQREAKKANVEPELLVRAILIDAIDEAMETTDVA